MKLKRESLLKFLKTTGVITFTVCSLGFSVVRISGISITVISPEIKPPVPDLKINPQEKVPPTPPPILQVVDPDPSHVPDQPKPVFVENKRESEELELKRRCGFTGDIINMEMHDCVEAVRKEKIDNKSH
jgi:hypothetical protein